MNDEVNIFEVPKLEEIMRYMPINPVDSEEVNTYIQNVVNLIAINYKYAQYQFAYFGFHLLYMTYIYCTVWKISKINPDRYKDAILFARTYEKKNLDLTQIKSIFEYSNIPEKELPKIFKIIGLDPGQIRNICKLVDIRNDMAHASGKFEILTEETFYSRINVIYISIRNVHKCMGVQIRKWYKEFLLEYSKGIYKKDYSNPAIIIDQEMIQALNLSIFELLVCNEMSVKKLCKDYPDQDGKFKYFKTKLRKYCKENEYLFFEE